MSDSPFDAAILQIWLQLAIQAYGEDNILIIDNYEELFQQMADRSAVWATIQEGDGLCMCGHDVEEHNDVWKKSTKCCKCDCESWRGSASRLWIHMEPLDGNLLSADDILDMEKKVKEGKVN